MNKSKNVKIQKHSLSNTEEALQNPKLLAPTNKHRKSKENKHHIPIRTEIKKTLVRNTEKQIPEVRITKDDLKAHSNKSIHTDTKKRQMCTLKNVSTSFDVPNPYTLVHLSKKIESLTREEQTKKESKIAADEKVLRNLNFPYDRPIYKDLVPLVCERAYSPPTVIRSPLPRKDKEPLLSDFVKPKIIPSYYILPSVDIEDKILPTRINNLRIFKILDINS